MTSPDSPLAGGRARALILFVLVAAFTVLIFGGTQIARYKPPIPERTVTSSGATLFTGEDVIQGQRLYLSRGGQHMGSVWGHGAYLAPDWSADALHRVGLVTAGMVHGAEMPTRFTQTDLGALSPGERGRVQALVAEELHTNRYDAATGTLTLSPGQAVAFPALVEHYTELFRDGRPAIGVPSGIVGTMEDGRRLTAFFFWTAWAAGTNRPDANHTYTAIALTAKFEDAIEKDNVTLFEIQGISFNKVDDYKFDKKYLESLSK